MAERDWLFRQEGFVCDLRAAGFLVRDGRILLQREVGGDEYALPGGHVRMGEEMASALAREWQEEMGLSVSVGRLLFTEECFWEWQGEQHHNIAFYFAVEASGEIPEGFVPHRDNPRVEAGWVPLELLPGRKVYPGFLKTELDHLPEGTKHFITRDGADCPEKRGSGQLEA